MQELIRDRAAEISDRVLTDLLRVNRLHIRFALVGESSPLNALSGCRNCEVKDVSAWIR